MESQNRFFKAINKKFLRHIAGTKPILSRIMKECVLLLRMCLYLFRRAVKLGKKLLSHPRAPRILLIIFLLVLTCVVLVRYIQRDRSHFEKVAFTNRYVATQSAPNIITSVEAKNDVVQMHVARNDARISFQTALNTATIRAKADTVSFETGSGTTFKYQTIPEGIKEEIILAKHPEKYAILTNLTVENVDPILTSEGQIIFVDKKGAYQFHVRQPFAKDAAGTVTYNIRYRLADYKDTYQTIQNTINKQTSYARQLFGPIKNTSSINLSNTYTLVMDIDPAWINDPKRAYPVTIDPTVVHDTSAEFATGQLDRVKDTGSGVSPVLETYYQELPADKNTVGLWHLNEAANDSCSGGLDACDSSGNGYHGTETTTAIDTSTQKLGAAARTYDTNGDKITTASLPAMSKFTYEAWAKFSSAAGGTADIIVAQPTNDPSIFRFTDEKIYVYADGAQVIVSNTVIADTNWHHYAITADGVNLQLYIDGALDKSAAYAGSSTNSAFQIGDNSAGTDTFAGTIDEVRVSNIARTPEEIKAAASRRPYSVYTSDVIDLTTVTSWNSLSWTELGVTTGDGETLKDTTSRIAQWNFNETSGTTANNDAEGTSCGGTPANCDGTLSGFDSTASQDADPDSSWTANSRRWGVGALKFDGIDTVVNAGNNAALQTTGDFSVESWFNTNSSVTNPLISYGTTTDWLYFFGTYAVTGGQLLCQIYQANSGSTYLSVSSLRMGNDNQWHHGVCTVSGTTISVYLDGKLEATSSTTTGTRDISSAGTLNIGKFINSTSNFFQGVIDSTRVYSRALTAAEILSNYNAGNVEFQTRVGATADANDGTWEAWRPVTNETQIQSFDSNNSTTLGIYDTTIGDFTTNQTWHKKNNVAEAASDTTGTQGRIPLGTNGTGDDTFAIASAVIKDGSTYKMWYLGNDGTNSRIFYATSPDGLTWTKYNNSIEAPSNTTGTNGRIPLGVAGSGDDDGTHYPVVIKDGSTYKMWYSGSDGTNNRIYYATSSDGLTWTKYNNTAEAASDTTGTNGRIPLGTGATGDITHAFLPSVIKDGSTYKMWYAGLNTNYRIYYATSSDGLTWTKVNNAIPTASNISSTDGRIPLGTSGADTTYAYHPEVIKDGTVYKMWYTMHDGSNTRIGYATSLDGLIWTKYLNTVPTASNTTGTYGRIPLGSSGGDNTQVLSAAAIKDGNMYKLWYGASDGTNYRIYYATMEPTPTNDTLDTTVKMESTASEKITLGRHEPRADTVALWHLNETDTSGNGVIKDSGPGANNVTIKGTPTAAKGISSKGRNFNGSTDYLCTDTNSDGTCDDNNNFDSLANYSVSAWIKTDAIGAAQGIVSKVSGTTYVHNFYVNAAGTLGGYVCADTTCSTNYALRNSTSTLVANQWYHVAMTWAPSQYPNIYINGALDNGTTGGNSALTGSMTNGSPPLTIGAHATPGNYFDGTIDEVEVSNTALSAEEIAESYRAGRDHYLTKTISSTDLSAKNTLPFYIAADRPGPYLEATVGETAFANYQPDANTIGLYHLSEQSGSGAYINDASGYGNLGTPTGATFTQGKIGGARRFDGSNDYVDLGTGAAFDFGNNGAFTQSGWVKPSVAVDYGGFVSKVVDGRGGTYTYMTVFMANGRLSAYNTTAGWVDICPAGSLVTGAWSHVAFAYNGTTIYGYVNGVLCGSAAFVYTDNAAHKVYIGSWYSVATTYDFNGLIDEVTISNSLRTADEIRQAYEAGLRTHPITIDFAAVLNSGNLITSTSDLSFTVDATSYGLASMGSNLYKGDKIIVRENVSGTEYIAQGTVTAVTTSTGAVTVDAWDTGSTVPSGGFTTNADVFKWQREYWTITEPLNAHLNATTLLTLRVTDGLEGRTVWLDDFRSAGDYLTTAAGSTITSSTGNRYFQYRTIFTSSDESVSSNLSVVTLDYVQNTAPATPTLDAPTDTATNQILSTVLKTTATDADSDYLRYKIELCTNVGMTTNCQTFDQTVSQTGWSGQNTQTNTAYTSGTQATYTIQTPLSVSTTYYWRSYAIDPGGLNTWSSTQGTPYSFTTTAAPTAPTVPYAEGTTNPTAVADLTPEFSAVHNDPNSDAANYYEIEVNTQSDFGGTVMWDTGAVSMTNVASGARSADVSYAGTALSFNGSTYYWRIRFTDVNGVVGAWSATQNFTMNTPPTTPSLYLPANGSVVGLTPVFRTTGTDVNSDYLRYKIELCTNVGMTTNCQTFDQTVSQTGWSGQNTQTNTAYTSGTEAVYTVQSSLSSGTTYYWRSYAIDPGGSNTWSSTQGTPYSFSTGTGSTKMNIEGMNFEGLNIN